MVTSEARLIFIENVVIIKIFSCLLVHNFFNDLSKEIGSKEIASKEIGR